MRFFLFPVVDFLFFLLDFFFLAVLFFFFPFFVFLTTGFFLLLVFEIFPRRDDLDFKPTFFLFFDLFFTAGARTLTTLADLEPMEGVFLFNPTPEANFWGEMGEKA